jgi:hypothetical protein
MAKAFGDIHMDEKLETVSHHTVERRVAAMSGHMA